MKVDSINIGIVADSETEFHNIRESFSSGDHFVRRLLEQGVLINYFRILKESDADGLRLDFVVGVEGDLMDYVKDFCVAKGGAKIAKMDVNIDESDIALYTEEELAPCQFHEFYN